MRTNQAIKQDELFDELAERLITAHLENDLDNVLTKLGSQLTDPIMNAIGRKLSISRHRDPVQTDILLELSKKISLILGSQYAQGIYLWHEASVGIFHNKYETSLEQFLRAEIALENSIEADQFVSLQANIIGIMIYLGQIEEASNRAEIVFQRNDLGHSKHLARIYTNLALGQKNLGNLDAAATLYHQAAIISHKIGDLQHEAIIAGNMAVVQREQGRITDARESLTKCRAYFEANGFIREMARTNITLGLIEARSGNLQLGMHYLDLARLEFETMDLHAEQATVAIYSAILHLNTNLLSDAHLAINSAIDLLKPLGLKWHLALALLVKGIIQKSLAHVEHSLASLATARTLFLEIGSQKYAGLAEVEIAENLGGTNAVAILSTASEWMSSTIPYVQSRLALMKPRFLMLSGAPQEAINILMGPDGNGITTLDTRQQIPALQILGECFEQLGQKFTARDHYMAACQKILFLCRHMYTDELRVAFLNGNSCLFSRLIDLSFDLFHQDLLPKKDLFFALSVSDQLEPMLTGNIADSCLLNTQKIESELNELREQWYWLDLQNEALLAQKDNDSWRSNYSVNIRSRVELEQEITHRMRIRESLLHGQNLLEGAPTNEFVSISRLKELLNDDELFVQYFAAGGNVHAFVANAFNTSVKQDLCQCTSLARLTKTWRFLTHSQSGFTEEGILITVLQQLYELLVGTLEIPLLQYSRLNIRLPDFMHDLPIHAFHDGEQFLIQGINVAFQHSIRLPTDIDTIEGRQHALIIGNDYLGTLPEIPIEAQNVAQLVRPFVRRVSNIESIYNIGDFCKALSDVDFVHFACHGTFREDNALFSKLHLGSRPITALDLSNVRFTNRPLIFINACRSGRGTTASSFSNGFVYNFLRQGAAHVVAAQWKIKDDLARVSSESFYQNLHLCASPVEALNRTQRIAIQNNIPVLDWASHKVWVA